MAGAVYGPGRVPPPRRRAGPLQARDQPMSRRSKVFELNRKGLNMPRGLIVLGVVAVPIIVLDVIGKAQSKPGCRGATRALYILRHGDRRDRDAPREPTPEAHSRASDSTNSMTRAG